jgi:hypothetical protein
VSQVSLFLVLLRNDHHVVISRKPAALQAGGTSSSQKGSVSVVGAVCPALDSAGKECCQEPVPWARIIDSGLFGDDEQRALEVYENEMLNKRIQESPFLHPCPGHCGRIVVCTHPPSNATNAMVCEQCQVRSLSRGVFRLVIKILTFRFPLVFFLPR